MVEHLVVKAFLFSTEAIVFGLLAFLLWMFYRGFGRQYVKFWSLSLVALSSEQITRAIQYFSFMVVETNIEKIALQWLEQVSGYFFLGFLLLGVYGAQKNIVLKRSTIVWLCVSVLVLGSFTALNSAFEPSEVYARFYLRVTFHAFIYGCGFLGIAAYLMMNKKRHFSSRILMYFSTIIGFKELFYSFSSAVAFEQEWFRSLSEFTLYFDSGAHAVLGFSMLIWLQGAERSIATNAVHQAQYLGEHDALTGTLNRKQVIESIPFAMYQANENKSKLSVFLIDIKRFKFVNDTYGLKTGDEILGEIAKRLNESIFKPLVVGRLSGDSFIFVVEFTDEKQIEHAKQHIHEMIERPYLLNDREVLIQCHLGYSFYPEHAESAEDLLQCANLALFQAETDNIASMQFKAQMQVHGRHLLTREREVKSAMANDEFVLYFQPQLNLLTNRLEGVEALVRWQHPTSGFLSPDKFLDDIDALGLNSEFDNYVLDKACQATAGWYQQYKRRIPIAVNITAVEFQDPKLIVKIQKLLFKYDIPPNYLELEITENVVMTDILTAMDTIVSLQSMGIKVSIDDFGTGYSSLAYLRKLPIDKIKIDQSFIHEMASNDSDLTIVKSMIKLSHGLGKRVLAEGVETPEQLEVLRKLGCDAVQGFFISKPISNDDMAQYLTRK